MSEGVAVALIAGFVTLATPVVGAWVLRRTRETRETVGEYSSKIDKVDELSASTEVVMHGLREQLESCAADLALAKRAGDAYARRALAAEDALARSEERLDAMRTEVRMLRAGGDGRANSGA